MTSFLARILALAALAALGIGALAKDDKSTSSPTGVKQDLAAWPVFRGNARQTGVAGSSLPEKLTVLWRFSTKDAIEGTPAIANGVVYIGSYDKNLYALDLATGNEKWCYPAGEIKAPVAFHNGKVY